MLRHLHTKNLAVIEEASVDFGPGLNVVTGETGAGKSLVVDSLALLAGARASADLIRSDAEGLSVTGVFEPVGTDWRELLGEAGIECQDTELVVRREVARSGRNRVFLDDHPVTLRLLSQLSPYLLRIHGQREELGLVAPDLQRAWLDRLGLELEGEAAQHQIDAVAAAYAQYQELARRLSRMTTDDRSRQERVDLLRYQAAEIAGAGLSAGEEDELHVQRGVLRHAEQIGDVLSLGTQSLLESENSIASQLARLKAAVERIAKIDPVAVEWVGELEELRIRAEDLGTTVRSRRDSIEADPAKLNGIEDRLAVIERLLRKYGLNTAAVLEHEQTVREELLELEGNDEQIQELEDQVKTSLDQYATAARRLTASRKVWSNELTQRMHRELGELALPSATLEVAFETRPREDSPLKIDGASVEFHPWGQEAVVFLFSSNPGESPRPLAKVASGGELSRLYLALQLASGASAASAQSGGALVFDEIDTGVGGAEAAAIGAKMQSLGASGQVLAVTHLPQVASFGDRHVRVEKQVSKGSTKTAVRVLDMSERVEELARMLGGAEITEVTRQHARELLGLPDAPPSGDAAERRGLRSVQ